MSFLCGTRLRGATFVQPTGVRRVLHTRFSHRPYPRHQHLLPLLRPFRLEFPISRVYMDIGRPSSVWEVAGKSCLGTRGTLKPSLPEEVRDTTVLLSSKRLRREYIPKEEGSVYTSHPFTPVSEGGRWFFLRESVHSRAPCLLHSRERDLRRTPEGPTPV